MRRSAHFTLKLLKHTSLVLGGVVLVSAIAVGVSKFIRWRAETPLEGKLTVSTSFEHKSTYQLGDFRVEWNGKTGGITVVNTRTAPGQVVFATPAGMSFVAAQKGTMTSSEKIGYFTLHRAATATYAKQTVASIQQQGNNLTIEGRLMDQDGNAIPYTFTLQPQAPDQLQYTVKAPRSKVNRIYLTWASTPTEGYYGFGVQYTAFNMNGRFLPVLVQEHGDGRGREPLTLLANLSNGAGGHWYNTYAPVPHFITSTMQSLYSENSQYQTFNFTRGKIGQLEVDSPTATGLWFAGKTPAKLVQSYTAVVGRMHPLPAWSQQGLIFGAEGGTEVVLKRLKQLQQAGVPVRGLWIQDWVGQRQTSFGDQLWWNWELNTAHYPHWDAFRSYLKQQHIQLLGYINPFLVDTSGQPEMTNLYTIAKSRGYFVKNAAGQPYPFQYPGFTAYLIDLTNPHAVTWYEQLMTKQLVDNGFTGWMADFGEELPLDAHLYNGETGATMHNEYPVLWQKLNQRVLQKAGLTQNGLVFFRSGFSTSPRHASAFWVGDQMESWGNLNGLQSSVTALLTSGLSGYSMEHSDIGGYTSIARFPLHYVRSPELLDRWLEVNAFTPLFRSHEGNLPAHNAQIYSSPAIEAQVRRFALVYKELAPYRALLMKQAATTGAPLDRPLFFNVPNDPHTYNIGSHEFMLGTDVLVAPVYHPNQTTVQVYLPAGTWEEMWTGQTVHVNQSGQTLKVAAPVGQPAVFSRTGTLANSELATVARLLAAK